MRAASPSSRTCGLDRCAQCVRYDKAILVGNGHTCRAARARAVPKLIALCRRVPPLRWLGGGAVIPLWQLILYGACSRSQSGRAGMAQKVTVALEDDLDGGPADETV